MRFQGQAAAPAVLRMNPGAPGLAGDAAIRRREARERLEARRDVDGAVLRGPIPQSLVRSFER